MKNATVMNDVQEIQEVLEEYIGKRKAVNVAVELMAVNCKTKIKATGVETIKIPSSDSPVYAELMKHKPANYEEKIFIADLKEATSKSIEDFEVFVNDPSMDDNGKLQFVPGFRHAMDYSYNQLEELAKENGLRLGTKDEYIMFMGWLINSLINEGWYEDNAWRAVCTNSSKLEYYYIDSKNAQIGSEITGPRMLTGKHELGKYYKVLAKDQENGGFWIASGSYLRNGCNNPLARIDCNNNYDHPNYYVVGWFVL